MTFREKLADLISGGALTEARNSALRQAEMREGAHNDWIILYRRLSRIAAQETPNANATVKRMARIARGEAE